MGKRAGVLTFTDLSQVQKTRENSELENFLSEMSVNRPSDLVSKISVIFQNGSPKRSNFFMNFKYREFASMRMGANYQMPVFGVKGETPKITRKANYVELLMCSEEELAGAKFNDVIFGTGYITGTETVDLTDNELIAGMDCMAGKPACTVRSEWVETVAHIVEKLWEASEREPRTRFVIEMDRAESRSMSLLQQIFLLIPQRLRLQLGFQTNITADDLAQIQNETVPIYLLTMDSKESIDPGKYSFPVVVYRLKDENAYAYNERRLQLIRKLAESVDEKFMSVLDNSEKEYLEDRAESSSSFRYYGDIVGKLFTGGAGFWWKSTGISSVSELKRAYDAQSELMKQEDFRREAFADFYGNIYPNSDIADDTMRILGSADSEERTSLLRFLMANLGQGRLLKAVADYTNRLVGNERAAGEARQRQLADGYEAKLAAGQQEILAERQRTEAVKEQVSSLQSQCAGLRSQNESLRAENERAVGEIERLQRRSAEVNNVGFGPGGMEDPQKLERIKEKFSELKEENQSLKKQKLIFTIASAVLGALAILFLILFLTKKPAPVEAPEEQKEIPAVEESVAPAEESKEEPAVTPAEESVPESVEVTPEATPEVTETPATVPTETPAETESSEESSEEAHVIPGGSESEPSEPQEETGTQTGENEEVTPAQKLKALIAAIQGDGDGISFGTDEDPKYFHVKFSSTDEPQSSDELTEDDTLPFIGLYVSTQQKDTPEQQYYIWTPADTLPERNTKGIPAFWFKTEEDDSTYYLHLATADDAVGTGFSTDELSEKSYFGWCINNTEEDPDTGYNWIPAAEDQEVGGK